MKKLLVFSLMVLISGLYISDAFASETVKPDGLTKWRGYAFKLGETATFTLSSNEANKNPFLIDVAYVRVSSDSDKIGLDILVEETNANSSYFRGNVQFGIDTDGVTTLKTNVGDLVYVEYNNCKQCRYGSWSAKILSSLDDSSPTLKHMVVTTDKASYSPGETVSITGEVRELYPEGKLSISVYNSKQYKESIQTFTVAIDADKKFIITHPAGSEQKTIGTYTIVANYEKNSWNSPHHVKTSFDVYAPGNIYLEPEVDSIIDVDPEADIKPEIKKLPKNEGNFLDVLFKIFTSWFG